MRGCLDRHRRGSASSSGGVVGNPLQRVSDAGRRPTKGAKGGATVKVQTKGVELVDPASVHEQSKPGQGHLHYQLDGGAVVATPATKLSFHELKPGNHEIVVTLAGNDHKPLGAEDRVTVEVPADAKGD
jgi:Family of unknown function (DUF6130)